MENRNCGVAWLSRLRRYIVGTHWFYRMNTAEARATSGVVQNSERGFFQPISLQILFTRGPPMCQALPPELASQRHTVVLRGMAG